MLGSQASYEAVMKEERAAQHERAARVELDNEADCAVCLSGETGPNRIIVFCEYCDIAVHQQCYGVKDIPEGDW